jgi:hypothetical protein
MLCISATLTVDWPRVRKGWVRIVAGKLYPDATTWVMRTPEGELQAVKVTAMTASHLRRWILYFRKKYRDEGRVFEGASTAILDALIQDEMITAPAIYAEAFGRGVYLGDPDPAWDKKPPVDVTVALAGPVCRYCGHADHSINACLSCDCDPFAGKRPRGPAAKTVTRRIDLEDE